MAHELTRLDVDHVDLERDRLRAKGEPVSPLNYAIGPHGGIFGRVFVYERAGDILPGHTHQRDHAVLVLQGRALIRGSAGAVQLDPGQMVEMPATAHHDVVALEDATATVCLFSIPFGIGADPKALSPFTE